MIKAYTESKEMNEKKQDLMVIIFRATYSRAVEAKKIEKDLLSRKIDAQSTEEGAAAWGEWEDICHEATKMFTMISEADLEDEFFEYVVDGLGGDADLLNEMFF